MAEAGAVASAAELLDAARRVAAEPAPTLSTVLDLLRDGAAGYLASALARGVPGPGPGASGIARQTGLGLLRDRLTALVGCALVRTGYASWRLSWTGPPTLAGIDITVTEFPGLVEAAVRSPAQARALRDHLAGMGVAVDMPLVPAQVSIPVEDTAPPPGRTPPGPPPRTPRQRRLRRAAIAVAALAALGATALAVTDLVVLVGGPSYGPSATLPDPARALLPDDQIPVLTFSPDGAILATGDDDGRVSLWNVATHRLSAVLAGPAARKVSALAFAPDGRTLAAAIDNRIYLWDMTTRRLASALGGPGGAGASALAFSPDGTTLAVGTDDQGQGAAYLWDTATWRVTATLASPGGAGVPALAFSPDGTRLATSDENGDQDGDTTLWDVASRRIIATLTTRGGLAPGTVAFSPDGKLLATGISAFTSSGQLTGDAYLWDLGRGARLRPAALPGPGDSGADAVAFSPDGRTLAVGEADGDIDMWSVATHQNLVTLGDPKTSNTFAVAFSPDGRTLASGDADGTAYLWPQTWP